MSFFEELQLNYEKAVEISKAVRRERAEKEAEDLLLPILAKHFRMKQQENPERAVITVSVIAEADRQIKIEANPNGCDYSNKFYYNYCLKKKDKKPKEEELSAEEVCEALGRIATKLNPNFRGNRIRGKECKFEYTINFIAPKNIWKDKSNFE